MIWPGHHLGIRQDLEQIARLSNGRVHCFAPFDPLKEVGLAASPDRIPRRTNMVRMAMSRQPRRVVSSHEAKRRRTWSGANPFGSPTNRRPATDGTAESKGLINDAVEMQEPEKGSKGRDRQFRRSSTLSRTTGHHKGDDVGCGKAFEIQRLAVSREPSLNERAHHVEAGARRHCRQSALDG